MMRSHSVWRRAFAISIVACAAASFGALAGEPPLRATVTVEVLAPGDGIFVGPTWIGFHDGSFDYFDAGEPSSVALERLAEDASGAMLTADVSAAGGLGAAVLGPGAPPVIYQGQTATAAVELDPSGANRFMSFATMIMPSNDGFFGNDDPLAWPVFDDEGAFVGADFIVQGSTAWDSGDEVNDEDPNHAPFVGPNAPPPPAPNTGVDENGVVSRHPGFAPNGPVLSQPRYANADFTRTDYPVLRITVRREIVPVHVSVEVLTPSDGIFVGPTWLGFHDGTFDFFTNGEASGVSLERLAEDASGALLTQDVAAAGGIGTAALGPNAPPVIYQGQSASAVVELSRLANPFFSYATMIMPSNDGFFGNDDPGAHRIFNERGDFVGAEFVVYGQSAWDSGDEVNDEDPNHAPFVGPNAPPPPLPNTGTDENGVVAPHPGFIPAGPVLSQPRYAGADFTRADYPVMRISVREAVVPVRVDVEVLTAPDGIFVGPTWLGFHDGSFDFFDSGENSSVSLERLAEDASGAMLTQDVAAAGGSGSAALGPNTPPVIYQGQSASAMVELARDGANRFLSFATMIMPSNDGFFGNDDPAAHPLFDAAGNFLGADFVVLGQSAWDSGDEVNDEDPDHAPFVGPNVPPPPAPNTGVDENGVVAAHPGFIPDGPVLSQPRYAGADFTQPDYMVLRVSARIARTPALANLSTRGRVGTGDGIMIGGLIVGGTGPRRVLVTGIGPDLANYGVSGSLPNPSLALMRGSALVASNDDWADAPNSAEIAASGLAPNLALESAILADLGPGEYTALLSGVGATETETTGIGLIQAFDLGPADGTPGGRLANISTRVLVGPGDGAMIGGFTIDGTGSKRVVVRALGPSLAGDPFNVSGTLPDPEVRLFAGQVELAANGDWQQATNAAEIEASGYAPANSVESAILIDLAPGAYTAVVSGTGVSDGVALVEIYEIP